MKTIRIDYVGCGLKTKDEKETLFLTRFLRQKYDVEITSNPDYIFYSLDKGQLQHKFKGIRIFITGENVIPNFNYCDYALGFHHLQFADRYIRWPLWRIHESEIERAMKKGKDFSDEELLNREFCSTVISNSDQTDGMREKMFETLSTYKQVASGGKWRNNVGGRVPNKIEFQRKYKFTLAAENTYAPGYTTEKLLQAFASDTIPIYYGDPLAVKDFNPEAFINAHDYKSTEELLEAVKAIDKDNNRYLKMMRASMFIDDQIPNDLSNEKLLAFFSNIFDRPYEEARRRFCAKPYQDIDFYNMKIRDMKCVVKSFFKRILKELKF